MGAVSLEAKSTIRSYGPSRAPLRRVFYSPDSRRDDRSLSLRRRPERETRIPGSRGTRAPKHVAEKLADFSEKGHAFRAKARGLSEGTRREPDTDGRANRKGSPERVPEKWQTFPKRTRSDIFRSCAISIGRMSHLAGTRAWRRADAERRGNIILNLVRCGSRLPVPVVTNFDTSLFPKAARPIEVRPFPGNHRRCRGATGAGGEDFGSFAPW